MSISRKYDQQIKAAGNNAKEVAKLEEQKEKELNKIKAKYADKQFIVTVAQVVASTAVSAMEAYKSMAGIPVVGEVTVTGRKGIKENMDEYDQMVKNASRK